MKNKPILWTILLLCLAITMFNCSKSKDNGSPSEKETSANVKTKLGTGNNFQYKIFYQEANTPQTRRGIIILAVGDGGDMNNSTLNAQCDALAKKGFVAITTTYRSQNGQQYTQWQTSFKQDIEQVIAKETESFNISRDKVVIGGLSRGGNLMLGFVLPGQGVEPITGIKGLILECATGKVVLYCFRYCL